MKTFGWILAGLLLLALGLAVYTSMGGRGRPDDRTSSVVIARGPHGQPVECVPASMG